MSIQDPIADLLTRIRNAQSAGLKAVQLPASKIKKGIVRVLKEEGYIVDFKEVEKDGKPILVVVLKYYNNKPVIEKIERVSKVSCQTYASKDKMPSVLGGLGIAIVTTSKGIMTGVQASNMGVGGEVLCTVY